MSQHLFISCVLTFVCSCVSAQQRFEIGIEGGLTKNYYQIDDPQNNLMKVPCESGFGGVNFRINTNKKFFLEVGFFAAEYTDGIKLKQQEGYLTTNHDEVLLIPFRVGYPIKISRKISIVPSGGITPSIKTLSQDGSSTNLTEKNSNGSFHYDYKFRELGKDVYFLVNGNLSIEWKFVKTVKASLGVSYYQGTSKISIADVNYQLNNGSVQTGELISRGSFVGYVFGLKYLLK